jgi:hypothetical protein
MKHPTKSVYLLHEPYLLPRRSHRPLLFMSECCITLYFLLSYMDTEQFEEAVRDYEKVYQTEKTKGTRTKGQRRVARGGCGLLGCWSQHLGPFHLLTSLEASSSWEGLRHLCSGSVSSLLVSLPIYSEESTKRVPVVVTKVSTP